MVQCFDWGWGWGAGQGDRFSRVALAGLELISLLAPVSQVLGLNLEGTRSSNSLHVETFSFCRLIDNGTSVVKVKI